VDEDTLANPHFDLGNWYCVCKFPRDLVEFEDDLNIDFSVFNRLTVFSLFENNSFNNEEEDLPDLHPGSDSSDDEDGPPGLYPISEVEPELEDNKDIPSLQSILDSDEDSDNHSDYMLDGELTENLDDDTIVYMSETDSDIDGQPYRPIGDVLGEMVAMILEVLDHYPGDSLFLQLNQTWFSISHIDHEFICIED